MLKTKFRKGWPVQIVSNQKGLAYTLKTRLRKTSILEDAAKIKAARSNPELAPLATAFDLKEDFFNIYDENPSSKDNAKEGIQTMEHSF